MNQKEKRKLENELLVLGLAQLDDPELIEQLALLVSSWPGDKHDYLRDLINEVEPEKRYEMYHAIAPKLRFKALTLEQYEAQIALKAGAMVSQGRMRVEGTAPKPVEINLNGQRLAVVPRDQSTGAVASVRCHRCEAAEKFLADTPAGAMYAARKAGWTREKGVNKETCPKCSEGLAATIVRLANGESLPVYDRRACKLDA